MAPRRPPASDPVPDRRREHAGEAFYPPRRRWEELSSFERLSRVLKEWWPLVTLASAGAVMLGFRVFTPSDEIRALRDETKALRTEIAAVRDDVQRTAKRTDALSRYRCLHIDAETAYVLDLDCGRLLPGFRYQTRDQQDSAEGAEQARAQRRLRGLREGGR